MSNKHNKILFILGSFGYGGTVFSTLNMISYLKSKYQIFILPMSPYGPVREYYSEYTILKPSSALKAAVYCPVNQEDSVIEKAKLLLFKIAARLCTYLGISFTDWAYSHEAKKLMDERQFDFVASTQEGSTTTFASLFKGAKRIAWFRTEYSVYKEQLASEELQKHQKTYAAFDQIVCVSKTTRDDFCKYFGSIQEKVVAVHNIQNTDDIVSKSREPVPDAFSKECFNIISVGRIAKQKQFHLIPMIADQLKKKYHLDFKWYIIGDGAGDAHGESERLENSLDKYDNREDVICLGSRLNPYPYIASADLLVNTSYYEACPRVVAEAKILHTPVVCADFSSAREFVDNDIDGFVGTIDELPSIIASLISDKNLYSRIKGNCDRYSLDNEAIFEQLTKIFS